MNQRDAHDRLCREPLDFLEGGVERLCRHRARHADHPSIRVDADLMSTTGVPSNARRLHRDGNGVFRREFSLPATSHAVAMADNRRNSGYRYLDTVLSKEI